METRDRGLFIERDQLQEIIREVLDLSQSMASLRHQSLNQPSINGHTKQSSLIQMFNNQPSKAQRIDTIPDGPDPTDTLTDTVSRPYEPSVIESIDTNIIAAKLAKQTEINWKDYYKVIPAFQQPSYEYNYKTNISK